MQVRTPCKRANRWRLDGVLWARVVSCFCVVSLCSVRTCKRCSYRRGGEKLQLPAGVFEGLDFIFQAAEQGLHAGFAFGILGDALAGAE